MLESLLRQWTRAPWHAWIKESPEWLDLIAEVFSQMPPSALEGLLGGPTPIVLLPPVHLSRCVTLTQAFPRGLSILQLDAALLRRPKTEQRSILAHELAHVALPTHEHRLTNDLAADRMAIRWGFGAGLVAALERDLPATSERLTFARKILQETSK